MGLTASPAPGGPQASVFDLKTITRLLLQPGVLPVFLVKVVCGFPFGESHPRAAGACLSLRPVSCAPCPPLSQRHRSHPPREGQPGRWRCVPSALPFTAAPEPVGSNVARSRPWLGGFSGEAEGRRQTALGRLLCPGRPLRRQ